MLILADYDTRFWLYIVFSMLSFKFVQLRTFLFEFHKEVYF